MSVTNYRVDVMVWNNKEHWGQVDIEIHNGTDKAMAEINQ